MGYNIKQNSDGSTSLVNERNSAEVLKLDRDDNITINGGGVSLASSKHSKYDLFDDFDGTALDAGWLVDKGSDTQALNPAVNAQLGGAVRLVTGDDATTTMVVNGSQLSRSLSFQADKGGLVFEARVKLSAITSISMFVGLTDQVASLIAPVTSAASANTITTNASDAVGFMFDTGMTDDNWWLVGVDGDTDATHQDVGSAPVAATYQNLRIEVDSVGGAKFFINGSQVGSAMTNAVDPTSPLSPVIAGFSEGAASRNIDADYIFVQQNR